MLSRLNHENIIKMYPLEGEEPGEATNTAKLREHDLGGSDADTDTG